MRTLLNLNIVVKIKYKSNLLGTNLISHKDHTIPVFQSMSIYGQCKLFCLKVFNCSLYFLSILLSNYLQLVTSTWSKKHAK